MKRLVTWVLAIIAGLAIAAALLLNVPAVQDRIITRVIGTAMDIRYDRLLGDDRLSVVLCGTSSPFPSPDRAQPCTMVIAAGKILVFDTGPGSWRNLALWRLPMARIAAVFLTHYHSDHIAELGEHNFQTWAAGRTAPLQVFGAPGVEEIVRGFSRAFAHDALHRTDHHGPAVMDPEIGKMIARPIVGLAGAPDKPETMVEVWRDGDLVVRAFTVDHGPIHPAIGYRIDYRDRSVVVSGDTIPTPHLIAAARDVDVLVQEAQSNDMVEQISQMAAARGVSRIAALTHDIQNYHTTVLDAGRLANDAHVGMLVLTHLTPPPSNFLQKKLFLRGLDSVRPDGWVLGYDGLLVELPVNSKKIQVEDIADARN